MAQVKQPETAVSPRFSEAFVYAAALHRHQKRKGTTIPYVSHLMAVASIVLEAGGNEDEAIAALLHDAVEDQGGKPTLAGIIQDGREALDFVQMRGWSAGRRVVYFGESLGGAVVLTIAVKIPGLRRLERIEVAGQNA